MSEKETERILDLARTQFEAAEVYEESGETVNVRFENNNLKQIQTRQRRGVGLRIIQDGRIGFASTTDLRRPEKLIEMAAVSAEFGDEARFEFPSQPAATPSVELWHEDMEAVSAEAMAEMGREALAMSREADDEYLFSSSVSRSLSRQRVLNTAGLDLAYRSTSMSSWVEVQEVREDGLLDIWEQKSWGRPFDSIADLAEETLRKMRQASTIVEARLETMPMIFVPKALGNLFSPVEVAISGKHVHKGSSVLQGRIGEQILDERLTVTDDPTVDFAPGSCPADDEGLPARRQHLFEAGVLRTYLADLQTAGLLSIEPTAHGFRGYSSRPSPSNTNTVVAAGDTPLEEMVGGLERGFIVDQTLGSGQSNTLAGEFSVNVSLGFLVEDGRIVGRVKDCMVAGNVYEVLKQVEAVGSEQRWLGSACAPPLMVGGLKLAVQG